jgi:hypothetical protein
VALRCAVAVPPLAPLEQNAAPLEPTGLQALRPVRVLLSQAQGPVVPARPLLLE